MKLLTRAFNLETYGVRLTMNQLSTLLAMSEGTIRNQVSAETFPIPTYTEGAKRYAAYDAVADYLDDMSAKARVPVIDSRPGLTLEARKGLTLLLPS